MYNKGFMTNGGKWNHPSSWLQQYFPRSLSTFGRKEEPELPRDVKQRCKIRAWVSCIIYHSRFSLSENGVSFPVFTFQILSSKMIRFVWYCIALSNRTPVPACVYTAIYSRKTLPSETGMHGGFEEKDDGNYWVKEKRVYNTIGKQTKNEIQCWRGQG